MEALITGIDRRGPQYYKATIDNSSGRPDIISVDAVDIEKLDLSIKENTGKVVRSVCDNLVMTKHITLPDESKDPDSLVRFELEQSMFENSSSFAYDVVESAVKNRYLGLITRVENLESKGMVRSLALYKGYNHFCKISESELLCLADVTEELVSIAFVYRGKPLDLAFITLEKTDSDFESKLNKAAVELKTMVNFKTNQFFLLGISVPFSALYLSGDISNRLAAQIFEPYFERKVRRPEYLHGYFKNLTEDLPLRKYLTAFGLAVN